MAGRKSRQGRGVERSVRTRRASTRAARPEGKQRSAGTADVRREPVPRKKLIPAASAAKPEGRGPRKGPAQARSRARPRHEGRGGSPFRRAAKAHGRTAHRQRPARRQGGRTAARAFRRRAQASGTFGAAFRYRCACRQLHPARRGVRARHPGLSSPAACRRKLFLGERRAWRDRPHAGRNRRTLDR